MKRLGLAFKFGFKFPVGCSVPFLFISMGCTDWVGANMVNHVTVNGNSTDVFVKICARCRRDLSIKFHLMINALKCV